MERDQAAPHRTRRDRYHWSWLRPSSLVWVAVLGGVLASFLALAIMWAVSDLEADVLGLKGPSSSIEIHNPPRTTDPESLRASTQSLRDYLAEHDTSLLLVSTASSPSVAAIDPAGRIPWARPLNTDSQGADGGSVYLIADTYSERTYRETGKTPLVPAEASVAGTVSIPELTRQSSLQYVTSFNEESLMPGTLYLSTDDPAIVHEVSSRLESMRVQTSPEDMRSRAMRIVYNSTVGGAFVLAAGGLLSSWIAYAIEVRRGRSERRIRRLVGATTARMAHDRAIRDYAALTCFFPLGAALTLLLTATVSGGRPQLRECVIVGISALIGSLVVWMGRVIIFCLTAWREPGREGY